MRGAVAGSQVMWGSAEGAGKACPKSHLLLSCQPPQCCRSWQLQGSHAESRSRL